MAKLQRYGAITPEEYEQAERDGKFLITDRVVCSYCEEPVTYRETYDPYHHHNKQIFYCQQHKELRLSMVAYPGYPAIPKEAPRYKQMHFFFSELERNRFSEEQWEYLAENKGCPFCDRYMSSVDRAPKRDSSLLNQPLLCPDCGVSFRIVVEQQETNQKVLEMRFQPEAKYIEDKAPPENIIEAETEINPATLSDEAYMMWFLETHLIEDSEYFQPYQEIYSRYEQSCGTNNRQPLEDRKLYQKLRELYSVENTRRRIDGIPTRGFIGIRCVDPTDD